MAVKRIRAGAALAAAVAVLAAAGPASADGAFSQFDTCLAKNGLSAVPADQGASAVQVCKTVKVTRVTNYAWTLGKAAAPPTVLLGVGQGAPITYTLSATATPVVQWVVDGDIVVRNNGPELATVAQIEDRLKLPDGATLSKVVSSTPFTLPANLCLSPPERVFHYTFTVPGEAVPNRAVPGSNSADVSAAIGAAPAAAIVFTAPVDFADGPNANSAVYNRMVTLTDAFDAPPAGVAIGPVDNPGPFVLNGDSPSPITRSFTSQATNVSLRCEDTAVVADVATLQAASPTPEKKGRPATPQPVPGPASATARVSVLVRAPGCGASGAPQTGGPAGGPAGGPPTSRPSSGPPSGPPSGLPPVRPAGAPSPSPTSPPGPGLQPTGPRVTPAGVPTPRTPAKPGVPAAGACPRPRLEASVIGPNNMLVGERPTWLLRVRNAGSAIARGVTLNERIPRGFSVAAASHRFTFRSGVMRFTTPALKRGQTFDVRVTLQAARGTNGPRVNRITVTALCGGAQTAFAPVTVSAVTG
jgi:hypothetical protein